MSFRHAAVICVLLSNFCFAQHHIKDSLLLALSTKPEPFFSLNNRNTFIQTNQTKLYGIIGGLEYNRKVKIYAGIYGFSRANRKLLLFSDFPVDSVYRTTSTSNFSLGLEYKYFEKNRISLSVPVQLGIGTLRHEYTQTNLNAKLGNEQYTMLPLEIGNNAYLELLTWLGLKAGIGYRINIGNREAAKYSSPFYNLGISVRLKKVYEEITN